MADQLRNPLCVFHIGLTARHVFDVVSVAHNQVDVPLQHGVDRLPVHAGAFHADVSDAMLGKPRSECFELAQACSTLMQAIALSPGKTAPKMSYRAVYLCTSNGRCGSPRPHV